MIAVFQLDGGHLTLSNPWEGELSFASFNFIRFINLLFIEPGYLISSPVCVPQTAGAVPLTCPRANPGWRALASKAAFALLSALLSALFSALLFALFSALLFGL